MYVDDALWERVRAAVGHMRYFDVPGQPDTLVDLVESALQVRLAELEAAYGPFRPVKGELKTGPGSQGRARLTEPRRPTSA